LPVFCVEPHRFAVDPLTGPRVCSSSLFFSHPPSVQIPQFFFYPFDRAILSYLFHPFAVCLVTLPSGPPLSGWQRLSFSVSPELAVFPRFFWNPPECNIPPLLRPEQGSRMFPACNPCCLRIKNSDPPSIVIYLPFSNSFRGADPRLDAANPLPWVISFRLGLLMFSFLCFSRRSGRLVFLGTTLLEARVYVSTFSPPPHSIIGHRVTITPYNCPPTRYCHVTYFPLTLSLSILIPSPPFFFG